MLMAAVLLNLLAAVLPAPSQTGPPVASAPSTRFFYIAVPRSTLETLVHSVPPTDEARFTRLQEEFAGAGCSPDKMKIQPLSEKGAGANIICTWPGNTAPTIVVVAHYRREGKGEGAVENWSGAILLPTLYLAIQAQPRENTFVFLESSGNAGTDRYMKSLTRDQKRHIRAMVSLDALGVSPTVGFYTPYPDRPWLPAYSVHLQMALMLATLSDNRVPRPQPVSPLRWLSIDDTQPFRYNEIPCIVLHSIVDTFLILPGSRNDTAAAIDGNAYYANYRAIAIYLVDLDRLAAKLNIDDPAWQGFGDQKPVDSNDLPHIH